MIGSALEDKAKVNVHSSKLAGEKTAARSFLPFPLFNMLKLMTYFPSILTQNQEGLLTKGLPRRGCPSSYRPSIQHMNMISVMELSILLSYSAYLVAERGLRTRLWLS